MIEYSELHKFTRDFIQKNKQATITLNTMSETWRAKTNIKLYYRANHDNLNSVTRDNRTQEKSRNIHIQITIKHEDISIQRQESRGIFRKHNRAVY